MDVLLKILKSFFSFFKIIGVLFRNGFPKKEKSVAIKERCFVVGNGPSLKIDLEGNISSLSEEDVLMVNHSCQTEQFGLIKPKYYLIADPGFWGNNDDNVLVKEAVEKTLNALLETKWDILIFIPFRAKKSFFVSTLESNNKRIFFYNNDSISGFDWFVFWAYKRGFGIPSGVNVIIPSLINVILLGYKKVYLLGTDHDWINNLSVESDNKLYLRDTHYYENPESTLLNDPLIYILECLVKLFTIYNLTEQFAKENNVVIKNCSSRSMIQTFPRISLLNAFSE